MAGKASEQPPDWFDGKTVALVGNAQSLFDFSFGKEIDDHDIVVRLNGATYELPKLDAAKSHGSRTDVWGMWSSIDYIKQIPYFNGKTIHLWKFSPAPVTYVAAPQIKAVGKKVPSCGLLMLDLLARSGAKHIDMYGFDWKKTKTFTAESMHIGPHDFVVEKQLIHNMYLTSDRIVLRHAKDPSLDS